MSIYTLRSTNSLPLAGVCFLPCWENSSQWVLSTTATVLLKSVPTCSGFPSVMSNSLYYSLRINSPLIPDPIPLSYSRILLKQFSSITSMSASFSFSLILPFNIQKGQYLSYLKNSYPDPKSIVATISISLFDLIAKCSKSNQNSLPLILSS